MQMMPREGLQKFFQNESREYLRRKMEFSGEKTEPRKR